MTENPPADDATWWQSKDGEKIIPNATDITNELIERKYRVGTGDRYSYKVKALLKGRCAEQGCLRYFRELEDCRVTYNAENGFPHEVDFHVTESVSILPYSYLVEVKLMRQRGFFEDYAINQYQYKNYRQLQDRLGLPLKIYFVDYRLGACVGNYLNIMDQSYEKITPEGKVVKYPLPVDHRLKSGEIRGWLHFPSFYMNRIFDLLPAEISRMRELTK